MSMLTSEYDSRRSVWSDIQDHLPTLYAVVAGVPGCRVLELGTRSGNSTAAFLAAAEAVSGHVTSVDIHRPQVPEWWFESSFWTVRLGSDMDPAVMADLPEEVDVLFIDTSHDYEHTFNELALYVPRVVPGGVVLLHDTELETPEQIPAQPPYPVRRAIDSYCERTGLTWTNHTGSYGLGVIDIPKG